VIGLFNERRSSDREAGGERVSRTDICDKLVHFTKGATDEEAFLHLQSMIDENHILGHNNKIKAGCLCVCFSEAPLKAVTGGLRNPSGYTVYSQFGIMFDKKWVFAQGGRPVIYEPDAEYGPLPEPYRWRHVRYEPARAQPIDFTWEREWRLPGVELQFGPKDAAIIVPSREWADRFVREHQSTLIEQYSDLLDDEYAGEYYGLSAFPWRIAALNE